MSVVNKYYREDNRLPFRMRDVIPFFEWLRRQKNFSWKEFENGWLLSKDKENYFVGTTTNGARATCVNKSILSLAKEFNVYKSIGKKKKNYSRSLSILENRCLELEGLLEKSNLEIKRLNELLK